MKQEFTICIQECEILVWDKSSPKPSQWTLNCFHKNLISMILGTSYILRITLALIYKPMTMQNKKRGCYKGKRISIIFFCFWVRHTATVQLTTHSSKAFWVKLTEKWSSQKPYQEVFKIEKKTKNKTNHVPRHREDVNGYWSRAHSAKKWILHLYLCVCLSFLLFLVVFFLTVISQTTRFHPTDIELLGWKFVWLLAS